jgi:hypothetical protein
LLVLHDGDAKERLPREFQFHCRGWLLQWLPLVSLHTCFLPLTGGGCDRDHISDESGCRVVGYEDDWRRDLSSTTTVDIPPIQQAGRFWVVDQYDLPFRLEMSTRMGRKGNNNTTNKPALVITVNTLVYPARLGVLVRLLESLLSSEWGGIRYGSCGVKLFEYLGMENVFLLAVCAVFTWVVGSSHSTFALLTGGIYQLVSIASLFLSPVAVSISHYAVVRDSVLSCCLFWASFAVLYSGAYQYTGADADADAPRDAVASQAFVAAGVVLSLTAWYALGLVRACCAAEYGLVRHDCMKSVVPFSLGIPHPIFTGQLLALMGGFLLPGWRSNTAAITFTLITGVLTLVAIYVEQFAKR